MMKSLLIILLLLFSLSVNSQIDTVCFSSNTPTNYSILPPSEGIPQWTVSGGGILLSGQGTSSIQVNWENSVPGTISNGISVTLINTICTSPVQTIDIFIFNPFFIPTFYAGCYDADCISLDWEGSLGAWTGEYVSEYVFCPPGFGGTFNIEFSGTYYGCPTTVNGTVTVDPAPILSPITW